MAKYLIQIVDRLNKPDECFVHFGHLSNPSPLMIVQFGYQKTCSGYGYGPNIRDHYLLHFVRKGTGVLESGKMEYQIGAGHIFAIYPHQISYYKSAQNDPWEYFWIGFEGLWSEEIMSRIGFEKDKTIATSIAQPERVFAILETMLGRIRSREHFDAQMMALMSDMYQLFQVLSDHVQQALPVQRRENAGKLGHEYTRTIISIIETSFNENINVQQLANHLNVNRSYLSELFKRDTGLSIKQYLTEYRLGQVIVQLQRRNKSIKTIALECGFEDPLYLSRVFRKRYGVSPQEWRMKTREQAEEKPREKS